MCDSCENIQVEILFLDREHLECMQFFELLDKQSMEKVVVLSLSRYQPLTRTKFESHRYLASEYY